MYIITKRFSFEMAHALLGYEGLCRNLHGHSYKMEVSVTENPQPATPSPATAPEGMVFDFRQLKDIVNQSVIDIFDHSLVLSDKADSELISVLKRNFERVRIVPFQPTTENLLAEFARRIRQNLPPQVRLHSLRLQETESSVAELVVSEE